MAVAPFACTHVNSREKWMKTTVGHERIKPQVPKRLQSGAFKWKKLTSFLALLVLKFLGAGCVLAAVRDPKTAGPQGSKEPVITGSV